MAYEYHFAFAMIPIIPNALLYLICYIMYVVRDKKLFSRHLKINFHSFTSSYGYESDSMLILLHGFSTTNTKLFQKLKVFATTYITTSNNISIIQLIRQTTADKVLFLYCHAIA